MRCARIAVLLLAIPAALAGQVLTRFGPGTTSPGTELMERAPSTFGVTAWTVGQWARYNINRTLNAQMGLTVQQFRQLSVVGQSGDQFWVEVQDDMMTPNRQTMPIRKMLLPFGPVSEAAMTEMLMTQADSSIRRVTMVRPPRRPDDAPKPFPEGWNKVGDEEVSTAAGKFRSVHWKKGGDEVWVSAQAGPIGVVKFQSEGTTIELVARSETGAKSRIPGVTP